MKKAITAIIVAGGKGTRLYPLTETVPKPMVHVGGKPLLEHTLLLFKKHGITNFIFALCYLPEVITDYFGDGSRFGVSISYIYEDSTHPRGTAGAIASAETLLTGTFIVTYADVLRDIDISEMIAVHTKEQAFLTLNVYPHTGSNYKSSLQFTDENILTEFTEMPTSTLLTEGQEVWSNGSLYICEPEIFSFIPKEQPSDFARDIFQALLTKDRKISVFKTNGYFMDIGTHETLDQAEKDILSKKFIPY